jgi:hypothetical protein
LPKRFSIARSDKRSGFWFFHTHPAGESAIGNSRDTGIVIGIKASKTLSRITLRAGSCKTKFKKSNFPNSFRRSRRSRNNSEDPFGKLHNQPPQPELHSASKPLPIRDCLSGIRDRRDGRRSRVLTCRDALFSSGPNANRMLRELPDMKSLFLCNNKFPRATVARFTNVCDWNHIFLHGAPLHFLSNSDFP